MQQGKDQNMAVQPLLQAFSVDKAIWNNDSESIIDSSPQNKQKNYDNTKKCQKIPHVDCVRTDTGFHPTRLGDIVCLSTGKLL